MNAEKIDSGGKHLLIIKFYIAYTYIKSAMAM